MPSSDDLILEYDNVLMVNEADYQNLGQYLAMISTTSILSYGTEERDFDPSIATDTPSVARALLQSGWPLATTILNAVDSMTEAIRKCTNSTSVVGQSLIPKTLTAVT